jgi:HPt (histidine-containing phosphotransfer) domain-containing protein
LAKSIRELETDKDDRFPIVAITASVMKEEIESCYAAGMDDYLPKPLEMPKLKDMLRKRMPEASDDAASAPAPTGPVDAPADQASNGGPIVGPIDPAALKSVFGDDEETFKEILADFVEPAISNVGEIEAAFASRSADGVAKAAHKLKSSARTIGANGLADLCQLLETAGNAEQWHDIDTAAPRLTAVMQKVTNYIEAL